MATLALRRPRLTTFAELWDRLGNIPLERIRLRPPPGRATVKDVVRIHDRESVSCELVDGVLVEKAMGAKDSILATVLIHFLWKFLDSHDLGIVVGEAGALELKIGLVRIPDVSFISWDRMPNNEIPDEPIPLLAPDLAVEVISESNTKAEMERKLRDYFEAGARLVWYVYPKKRAVHVYTAPDVVRVLGFDQTLDGGEVLPGFKLPLKQLFTRAIRRRGKRG